MELAFFLKDKKTPFLRPRLPHIVGQFTDTQAGAGISTGGDESQRVPHLAEECPLKILLYTNNLHLNRARHVSLLVPALPPSPGRQEEAQEHAPLQGRTQVQDCKRSLTHAAIGAAIHGYSRQRPACIQVRSLTLSGEGQASVPPLSP